MGKLPARQVFKYDSMADFEADGGVANYGDGSVIIGQSMFVVDGGRIQLAGDTPLGSDKIHQISPNAFEVRFGDGLENISATNRGSGGGITATTFGNGSPMGTEIGWRAGTVMADGQYVSLFKNFAQPLDLSNVDNFLFEMIWPENHAETRLNIIFGDTGFANAHRYVAINGGQKTEVLAFVINKADFGGAWQGAGANWGAIQRIEFRFTSSGSGGIADLERSVIIRRIEFGGFTKPIVMLSFDDVQVEQYDDLPLLKNRNIYPALAVTDIEIANTGAYPDVGTSWGKMTKSQMLEFAEHGCPFVAHNNGHKSYGLTISSYSKTGTIVTLVVDWGSSTNTKQSDTANVGDKIYVDRCAWYELNGFWTISAISALGASTRTISFDIGNTNPVKVPAAADGGMLTIIGNYDYQVEHALLRELIKSEGLRSLDTVMCYTYGENTQYSRRALASNGVRVARSTGYARQSGFGLVQLRRKMGRSLVTTYRNTAVGRVNTPFLSLPTFGVVGASATFAAYTAEINNLLAKGGILSIYWHGDTATDGATMTPALRQQIINDLADKRDAGLIELPQWEEFVEMI